MPDWKSLAPGRARPTSIDAIVSRLDANVGSVVRTELVGLADAVSTHFPENIFVDLDRVASTLVETVESRSAAAAHEQGRALVRLHSLFGGESAIRFRYVHDFLYGFDWARWVAREPSARASVGPFDDEFLAYSEMRARELLQLIAHDDAKYGPLEAHEHRNPFPFRRDPEAERAILHALAAEGAIPVEAWRADACCQWDRPYTTLRESKALALGLVISG